MQTKIDWLSFTGVHDATSESTAPSAREYAINWLHELSPIILDGIGIDDGWQWSGGRKPYSAGWRRNDNGVTIYINPKLPHFLVEISGRGCDTLGEYPYALAFLEAIKSHATRIDLACDMLTETRPTEFTALRNGGRFKSKSDVISESGETCYIGSKTSNLYARVYRYNPPHERSHLLRCEYVLRAEDAKNAIVQILEHGKDAVVKALGVKFDWKHPDWDVRQASLIELKAYRPERREGKTLFWLTKTVAPLLVRLCKETGFSPQEWLDENVLSNLSTDELPQF